MTLRPHRVSLSQADRREGAGPAPTDADAGAARPGSPRSPTREENLNRTDAEKTRLNEARSVAWRRWGPYLADRQWGTVREDYGPADDSWSSFPHDHASFRAYRWGEDGLAGFSDDKQRLCFAVALWNEADVILKERLFGLANTEGNHGEDVKEYYFHLDATPTSSYLKFLYKYPQSAFPYELLVAENRRRTRADLEYELLDTGVFDHDRYHDIVVEYAKGGPEEILIRLTAHNRGPEAAWLHLLPTLWFRNTWSWHAGSLKPVLRRFDTGPERGVHATHPELGDRWLYCEGEPELLFTENETNEERLHSRPNPQPYVKDAFHRHVVHGEAGATNPEGRGTKAAAHYRVNVPAGGSRTVRLRLSDERPPGRGPLDPERVVALRFDPEGARRREEAPAAEDRFGPAFETAIEQRRREADAFHDAIAPAGLDPEGRHIQRQALAGLLWNRQCYRFDVAEWLAGDDAHEPVDAGRRRGRNRRWRHLAADDVLSMPDKWEYPWFAAWDLAFHSVALQLVDPEFAKEQIAALLRPWYLHPNGQVPAYEWNFSDVNPPVQAWAAWRLYQEEAHRGRPDRAFLEGIFRKLLLNFTWWVNRKDTHENNVFEGGFLGLDNIGVFDRSAPLPGGGMLEQADGTAWMALYALNLFEIAIELAAEDPGYQEIAGKFYEHFVYIAAAMDRMGEHRDELWDEKDGFYYDLLRFPDGRAERIALRSLVGLLPLVASALIRPEQIERLPDLHRRIARLGRHHPELTRNVTNLDRPGPTGRRLLSVLNETKLRRILARLFDEREFLSPYGIRSLSRAHLEHPLLLTLDRNHYRVAYEPAESQSWMFGGNSNWRGPVWFPINALLVDALQRLHGYYGPRFRVELPTGSGRWLDLDEAAREIGRRLVRIFRRENERRAVYGGTRKFQEDPHWRDLLLFYEYFHGDDGAGIGASHQTGWTALVALFAQQEATADLEQSSAAP